MNPSQEASCSEDGAAHAPSSSKSEDNNHDKTGEIIEKKKDIDHDNKESSSEQAKKCDDTVSKSTEIKSPEQPPKNITSSSDSNKNESPSLVAEFPFEAGNRVSYMFSSYKWKSMTNLALL